MARRHAAPRNAGADAPAGIPPTDLADGVAPPSEVQVAERAVGDSPGSEPPAPSAAADIPEAVASARELALELSELRDTLRQVTDAFVRRVDAKLAAAERLVGGRRRNGRYTPPPSLELLQALRKEIRGLKVKPEKGRAKDLVRLKRLADAIEAAIEDAGRS